MTVHDLHQEIDLVREKIYEYEAALDLLREHLQDLQDALREAA